MIIDIAAMAHYLTYRDLKYIAPAKAGERMAEMEIFKKDGQSARVAFVILAKMVDEQLVDFSMQKVSGWMNQAQVGRPLFFCYYHYEGASRLDPTFAIRLLTLEGRLGISVEVSFIERGVVPETVARQNQVLDIPASDGMYYLVQQDGENHREEGTEEVRLALREKRDAGVIRKALVKHDIPDLAKFETDETLIAAILEGFQVLSPYFEATRI